jgi:hypothetical protein
MQCVLLVSRYKLLEKGTLTSCGSVNERSGLLAFFLYLLDDFAGTKCVESSRT